MNHENQSTDTGEDAGFSPAWICALVVIAAFGVRTLTQGAIWMHLAAGRWIAGNGIPRTDPFSYTKGGAAWTDLNWLYEAGAFLLSKAGIPLLTLSHVAVVVIAFVLLARPARMLAGPVACSVAAILCGWMIAPLYRVTPDLFALLFPAVMMATLSKRSLTTADLVILGVTQVLWTNVSSTFVAGPVVTALFAAGTWYRGRQDNATVESGALPRVMTATGIVAVCMALNPYGPKAIMAAVHDLIGQDAFFSVEWISPFFRETSHQLPRHLNALALGIGAGGLLTYRKHLPMGLTLVAIFGAVCSLSLKTLILFPILAFPFLALSLSSLTNAVLSRIPNLNGAALLRRAGHVFALVLAAGTLWALVTNQYYRASGSASSFGLGLDEEVVPAGAGVALEKAAFPQPMIHLPGDAGFLVWRYPNLKLFIDSRNRLHGADFYHETALAFSGRGEDWNRLAERWGPQSIVLNATWPDTGPFVRGLLSAGDFEMVYFDGTTVILLERAAAQVFKQANPGLQQSGLDLLEARRQALRGKLGKRGPMPFSGGVLGSSYLFYSLGRVAEAEAASELVTLMCPSLRGAWERLGVCRLERGDANAAVQALERAVEKEGHNVRPWLWLSEAHRAAGDTEQSDATLETARSINAKATESFLENR